MGAVVVADQMHVQVGGDLGVDEGQELAELDGAVAAVQGGDHGAVAMSKAANRLVVPCRT